MTDERKSQADKFKDAARNHAAGEDEAGWEGRLKKVVKRKKGDDETANPLPDAPGDQGGSGGDPGRT